MCSFFIVKKKINSKVVNIVKKNIEDMSFNLHEIVGGFQNYVNTERKRKH